MSIFQFGAAGDGASKSTSVLDRPRPKTPDTTSVFAFHPPSAPSPAAPSPVEEKPKYSVLARPRPRTPDSQAWLDRAVPGSRVLPASGQSGMPAGTRAVGWTSSGQHRPTGSSTTTNSTFSSSNGGSFDSLGPFSATSGLSSSTPISAATFVRPSLEATSQTDSPSRDRFSTGGAPLLKLDFDFGSAFGSTETMFGLSDFCHSGNSSECDSLSATAPAASTQPVRSTPSTGSFATLAPSSGRPSRKEPPQVDVEPNDVPRQPSVAAASGGAEGAADERAKRPRLVSNGDTASRNVERDMREQASSTSLQSSAQSGAFSDEWFSAGAPGLKSDTSPRPQRRRRRSLASLLSIGPVTQMGERMRGTEEKDDALDVAPKRPFTPEPDFRRSRAAPQLPPSLPEHAPPSSISVDKSLPPTPFAPSPAARPYPPHVSASSPGRSDGPTKRSFGAAVESANKGLNRQISRLRNRPPASAEPQDPRVPATIGKVSRGKKDSLSSIDTFDTHDLRSRDTSFDHTSYPSVIPFSASYAAPGAPPAASARSTSMPLGRRLVEHFTKGSYSSKAGPDVRETVPPPRPGRRRSSLSSLLGVGGSASADGHAESASASAPKKLLGMSLPAGRKSEDLLTSGRLRSTGVREMRRAWNEPPSLSGQSLDGRRSFDALRDARPIARTPSTDDLLNLAAAKLSKLTVASVESEPPISLHSVRAAQYAAAEQPFDVEIPPGPPAPAESAPLDPSTTVEKPRSAVAPSTLTSAQPDPSRPAAPSQGVTNDRVSPPTAAASGTQRQRAPLLALPRREPSPPMEPPVWRRNGMTASRQHGHQETHLSNAWLELEDALRVYTVLLQERKHDRGAIVGNIVLPFLQRDEDRPVLNTGERLAKRQRDILFEWLKILSTELQEVQPTHRGLSLEAVAGIAESHHFSAFALRNDTKAQNRYRSMLIRMLGFAVEKLNDKAVYANTLAFSGRVFALAFFRVEGVALKLLRALPTVKRQALRRVLQETGIREDALPPADVDRFPPHLSELCLRNFSAYVNLHIGQRQQLGDDDRILVRDGAVEVEMLGNWLIRWTASDSDLPFAFYRAYHHQLAAHLVPPGLRSSVRGQRTLPPSVVITAPGFLFLAASLLDKSDALVHRNLRSVTSIGPNSGNFAVNDSANLSFGQKPKVLELAHRRVVQTMVDIYGGAPSAPASDEPQDPDAHVRRYLFAQMLPVWIRACVKRTSLWDTRSVYLVLDLVEGLVYQLAYPSPSESDVEEASAVKPDEAVLDAFDLPFLFSVVRKILLEADGTVTLMRTISFLYSHFPLFTLRGADRTELCEGLILYEAVFQRLFLHWNSGVRGYFIRLLVWRVSRLGVVAQEQNPNLPPDEGIVAIFNLLNVRLEALRKRHDQLEPFDALSEDDFLFRPKRSTICSTRGVKEAPWTVDELAEPVEEEEPESEGPESEEVVRPSSSSAVLVSETHGQGGKKQDQKTVSKVVSWLKGGMGKKQSKGRPSLDAKVDPVAPDREDSSSLSRRKRIGSNGSDAASTGSQDLPLTVFPTTVETGSIPDGRASPAPRTTNPVNRAFLSPPTSPLRPGMPSRQASSRSEKRRSHGSAFFAFEFENGVVTRTDVDPALASSAGSVKTAGTADTALPTSPIRPRHAEHPALSPRVSLRFSKRISILPPAALDLLREASGVEDVPPIPAKYRETIAAGYDKKLHPYAVRGLSDYEDALDEWTDWVASLQEDEELNGRLKKSFVDVVPRLGVNWPLQQGED
ncbi:proteophosphoglycan ppg4 [Rhodotorula toruloides]|uniref:Proteophosphoglycan ppg4 n=1 Tax=Rhodotorula toruloides TaxID=5286 RepID=A0A511KCF2_RHOTO|nr:proteophosphoglycan ppg4 [Rhodotorula toruloides]